MSKRYADPIEVETDDGAVEAFWWRGRRYRIRRVLTRWRESGGWWEAGDGEAPWRAGDSHEVLRVDATSGWSNGTYEIERDLRDGGWRMHRVWD